MRGVGLMAAVELDPDSLVGHSDRAPSLRLVDACQEAGLLLVPSGANCVRWLPPLNVSAEEIDRAADIFRHVLSRMEGAKP